MEVSSGFIEQFYSPHNIFQIRHTRLGRKIVRLSKNVQCGKRPRPVDMETCKNYPLSEKKIKMEGTTVGCDVSQAQQIKLADSLPKATEKCKLYISLEKKMLLKDTKSEDLQTEVGERGTQRRAIKRKRSSKSLCLAAPVRSSSRICRIMAKEQSCLITTESKKLTDKLNFMAKLSLKFERRPSPVTEFDTFYDILDRQRGQYRASV